MTQGEHVAARRLSKRRPFQAREDVQVTPIIEDPPVTIVIEDLAVAPGITMSYRLASRADGLSSSTLLCSVKLETSFLFDWGNPERSAHISASSGSRGSK
jgi:hypothetical protein